MTLLTPRESPKKPPVVLVLGAAAGPSGDDFLVLGYSHEYDDFESARHSDHEQNTFVLRYRNRVRTVVSVVPQRLEDLWLSEEARTYAVGEPRGVLEITSDGVTETTIEGVRGTGSSIWGADEQHVFVCGSHQPFWLYRRQGMWNSLDLPKDVSGLWRVAGHDEHDVYAVSDTGEILHFDGTTVQRLDSPTTRWLVAMAPMPDRRMCIGGHEGILLYGDTHGWRTVESGTDGPILNLVPFRDGACFATPDGVWLFDGRQPPQLVVPKGGRWLSRAGDALIVVNDEVSWLYDGTQLVQLDTAL